MLELLAPYAPYIFSPLCTFAVWYLSTKAISNKDNRSETSIVRSQEIQLAGEMTKQLWEEVKHTKEIVNKLNESWIEEKKKNLLSEIKVEKLGSQLEDLKEQFNKLGHLDLECRISGCYKSRQVNKKTE